MNNFICITDKPDLLKKHLHIDLCANCYNRTKIYQFLQSYGSDNPIVIYKKNEPELEKPKTLKLMSLG